MVLETVQFLRTQPLSALTERYGVSVRRHPQFPSLVFLKYDQLSSPMGERIVQECRGLILDEADGWRVVSYPFGKFFNHGEPHAAPIDWATARVYEKLDGSLMTLYPHAGHWRVASNGTPDAGGPVPDCGGTFAELFARVWRESKYEFPPVGVGMCFMFELMTPWNRIIVRHGKPRLVLIGARSLDGGMAESPPESVGPQYGWECVRSFPLGCIDDCLRAAGALSPMESEGYVVCDARWNRVKVKSPQYVALAHLKESVTARRLLDIIRKGESAEFLTYFPEWRADYEAVKAKYDALCDELEADYARLRGIPDQKAFAAEAVRTRCSSPLFSVRKGSCQSVREFFASASLQCVERAVGELPEIQAAGTPSA